MAIWICFLCLSPLLVCLLLAESPSRQHWALEGAVARTRGSIISQGVTREDGSAGSLAAWAALGQGGAWGRPAGVIIGLGSWAIVQVGETSLPCENGFSDSARLRGAPIRSWVLKP